MGKPPSDERYIVSLDVFEGPLDLLLHLIRTHELDIFDIPIAFVTAKYLEYLELMKEVNLDLAAEYLEMAATLLRIKSRMLVPSDQADEEPLPELEGPDPREELVRRLLEYQKYKSAAEALAGMPMLGRDTFPRGILEQLSEDRDLAPPGLFALMEAFQNLLKRADLDPVHEVSITRISVSERINQLVDIFRQRPEITFDALFEQSKTRNDLVVSFISLLEMVRLGLVRVLQASESGEIHITASPSINEAEQLLAKQILEE